MWGGRFAEGPSALMREINASIAFDKRLWRQDIEASRAHVAMLCARGIVSQDDSDAIEEGDVTGLARMLASTPPNTVIASGGRSLLMVAVEESNLPAVQLLVQRGAALNQRDERGTTALALASEMGFQEAVEVLLAAGAEPNLQDASGMSALDIAEEHGAHDISTLLLRYGAKPSKESPP